MISHKGRESRRGRASKMSKTIERLYREKKCRDCTVVVTRMNFAKILGKFTKVKIQYESSSPKSKPAPVASVTSPNSNARLKSNENGMVLIHRNAYSQHPVKELLGTKTSKSNDNARTRITNNVLKENNRLKRPLVAKEDLPNHKKPRSGKIKQYGIIFLDPIVNNNNNNSKSITLEDLLPLINKNILPSDDWCIDYFPKNDEPKDDKIYDRIAAELEDLMYNEKKSPTKSEKNDVENNGDEFPSIMDILNDTTIENKPNNTSDSAEIRSNLESSDVEAMLLGKPNESSEKVLDSTQLTDVNPEMNKLIDDVEQFNPTSEEIKNPENSTVTDGLDNPNSPSILDDAIQKGIEEHIPSAILQTETEMVKEEEKSITENESKDKESTPTVNGDLTETCKDEINTNAEITDNGGSIVKGTNDVTHVVFSKRIEGQCHKSVMCPKNLKYGIELEGKPVEFIGAPKFISSLEDLKVLLQIVNESDIESLYVLHS